MMGDGVTVAIQVGEKPKLDEQCGYDNYKAGYAQQDEQTTIQRNSIFFEHIANIARHDMSNVL